MFNGHKHHYGKNKRGWGVEGEEARRELRRPIHLRRVKNNTIGLHLKTGR